MSRAVDVLAVMGRVADDAQRAGIPGLPQTLRDARAAAAELIEASRVVAECRAEGESAKRVGAMARLRVALARCQPKGD